MPAIDKAKAEELIAQLELHQKNQIQYLQALLGLVSNDDAKEGTQDVAGAYTGHRLLSLTPAEIGRRFSCVMPLSIFTFWHSSAFFLPFGIPFPIWESGYRCSASAGATDATFGADKMARIDNERREIFAHPVTSSVASAPHEAANFPENWAMPWTNNLLRQRIQEREKNPGCGRGGFPRHTCHRVLYTGVTHTSSS